MVTEAGKELLRNTLNTAKFHNRILEENEMWKQWELEQGLTMMVSDDVILNRSNRSKRHHQCSKHRREREQKVIDTNSAGSSKSNFSRELYPDEDESDFSKSPALRSSEKKWDHSGFLELYPEEAHKGVCLTSKESSKKWDHSGFLELYPEETHKDVRVRSSFKPKEYSDKWDHSGFLELYPEEAQKDIGAASGSKEHSKKHKKKRKHHSEVASNSDSEIWEEFKMYKRSKAAKNSKTYDGHIKDWKKHSKK